MFGPLMSATCGCNHFRLEMSSINANGEVDIELLHGTKLCDTDVAFPIQSSRQDLAWKKWRQVLFQICYKWGSDTTLTLKLMTDHFGALVLLPGTWIFRHHYKINVGQVEGAIDNTSGRSY